MTNALHFSLIFKDEVALSSSGIPCGVKKPFPLFAAACARHDRMDCCDARMDSCQNEHVDLPSFPRALCSEIYAQGCSWIFAPRGRRRNGRAENMQAHVDFLIFFP
jgi:hypothetical protein